MIYINPFSLDLNNGIYSGYYKVTRETCGKVLLNYKNVQVYKKAKNHYVYIHKGICISERAGISEQFIDIFFIDNNNFDRHRIIELMNKYDLNFIDE